MSTHARTKGLERRSAIILIAVAVLGLLTLAAQAQDDGQVYRMIDGPTLGAGPGHVHSWIDRAPDGRTLAVAGTASFPLLILDATDLRIVRSIDVGNWNVGPRARHSATGKYLLLEEIEYLAYSPNKDKERRFAVLDLASGSLVVKELQAYAAAITPDERSLYSTSAQGVSVTDLATGERRAVTGLERSANALALSPDGERIALAYRPTEADLAQVPTVRNDKKAIKAALRIGQVVLVHDLATGERLCTVAELFDKVFRLEHSPDGAELWIHAKPGAHKGANPDVTLSYVDVADPLTGAMGRSSFPSHALYEPSFTSDAGNARFAIGSQRGRFLEVHLYDRTNASMAGRFVIDDRLFRHLKEKGEKWSDARVGFALLPDGERLLMTFGSRLIEWTYAP